MTAVARTVRIGITGPIGCGKSQVGRWLAERGARVVDADHVAREVTAPGTPVHAAILRRFGAAVTAPDGTLDRAALGRVVFADPAALRDLEALVHPAVRPRILELIAAAEADGAAGRGDRGDQARRGRARRPVRRGVARDLRPRRRSASGSWRAGRPPADADQRIAAQAGIVGAAPAVRDPRAGHVRRGGGDAGASMRRRGAGRRRLSATAGGLGRNRPER